MQMLLSHPHSAEVDFSGWKVVIGGSAMSQTLAVAAQKRGIDVFTGYGMSETCPVLTLAHLHSKDLELPAEEQAPLRCKTGLPLPLVDLRIVDDDGEIVRRRVVGPQDDEVVKLLAFERDRPADEVGEAHLTRHGRAETDDIRLPFV